MTKTQGVVMNYMPYKESSIITRIFTEEFGYRSFIVNGVRSAKSRQRVGNFQPLTILDLVLYLKEGRDLHRISEFKATLAWHHTDIRKQSVLLFLAEVVDKLLRNEHTEEKALFATLSEGLRFFYEAQEIGNFHVQLMLRLIHHLGLSVTSARALFENMNQVSDQEELEYFIDNLLQAPWKLSVPASGHLRYQSLEIILQYFRHHVPNFGKVHSLKVLKQVFNE